MKDKKLKISILSPDLSANSTGRSYLLAKILQKKYNIEIVGPCLKNSIWSPIKDKSINFKIIQNRLNFFEAVKKIDGDIIYAIKPLYTSFLYGLIKKIIFKKPLILDIDDWELGFYFGDLQNNPKKIFNPNWVANFFIVFFLEIIAKFIKCKTVSGSFLKNKFGGILIPHARDEKMFCPINKNRTLKNKLGLSNKKIILFLGTAGKHKGLDDLVNSFKDIKKRNISLLIVGINKSSEYHRKLIKDYSMNKKIKMIGEVPFNTIPNYLSIADLIVLPQKESKSAIGQVPAKVFDAMAMGKPIIATDISDLPKILKDCGIIIKCGDVKSLSKKIKYIFDNPKIARELGKKARKKFLKEYSFDAVTPKLFKVFDRYKK